MKLETKKTSMDTLNELLSFDFILAEGRKGHHLLFDTDLIDEVFKKNDNELMNAIEKYEIEINEAVNELFTLPGVKAKRTYIAKLSQELQHALVFGYFQLLDAEINGVRPDTTIH